MNALDPSHPLFALAGMLLAFGTALLLQRQYGAPPLSGRFAGIDGLRGFLAFGVFLHHASIWFFYQHSGRWELPPSRLYTHLGQSSVALFFMITGFLFFSKLIDARQRPLDWLRLFVSRVLRLVPLYVVVMLLLFIAVAVLSGGKLHESPGTVAREALHWLGFTMLEGPPINRVALTQTAMAGVTWSLPYEWFFYGTLPILALTVGVLPRWPYLLVGVATLAWLLNWHAQQVHLWTFAGGIAAAWGTRSAVLCRFAESRVGSALALVALAAVVGLFPSGKNYGAVALLGVFFLLIACGNTLFGLLLHPASRLLGEMAYGIYLLHGLLLFTLFHFLLKADRPGAALSAGAHWAWVLALGPVVVLAGFASFRFIEAPAMRATSNVTNALRRWVQKSPDRLAA